MEDSMKSAESNLERCCGICKKSEPLIMLKHGDEYFHMLCVLEEAKKSGKWKEKEAPCQNISEAV